MEWQRLLINIFERVFQGLEKALSDLSQVDLDEQPNLDCNSIGWLAWHLTRAQDRAIEDITGEKQVWMKERWYTRFNRAPDPSDTGFGHKSEDVAAFTSPNVGTLVAYHRAVFGRLKQYLGSLSATELDRKLDHPVFPTVSERLVALLNDNLQHVGQIAYLRGLLKGKGWLDI